MWNLILAYWLPCVMYSVICHRWSSWSVPHCIFCIYMYSIRPITMFNALMFIFMSGISLSLSSVWFLSWNSQLWKDLIQAYILFWFWTGGFSNMCWSLCDWVATSFLKIVTSGLWSAMILIYFLQDSNDGRSLVHVVSLMPPSQCCCTFFLWLICSYWQMHSVSGWWCQMLHFTGRSLHL